MLRTANAEPFPKVSVKRRSRPSKPVLSGSQRPTAVGLAG